MTVDSSKRDSDTRHILESSVSSLNTLGSTNEINQERNEEPFNYDDILDHIGQLGKSQLLASMLLLIPGLFPGIVVMSYTITGYIPKYGCYSKECANNTTPWLNPNFTKTDVCSRYNPNKTSPDLFCQPIDNNYDTSLLETCDSWVYDTSVFHSTIITDFNLACDDEWMQTLAGTAYMFGMFFGGAVLGNLADIIGRRLSFTLNTFALAAVMTGSAFSPNMWTFCVFRFFCGVVGSFQFNIVFVWGVEAVGKKYRTAVGSLYSLAFSLGSTVCGLIAYFIRDWRTLQLVISIPMFLPVAFYWILPESTRWLITKKRYDEATKLIQKAAKMNGKPVPEHLLIAPNDNQQTSHLDVSNSNEQEQVDTKDNNNIITVLRTPVLCIRLLVMFFAWIASLMSYYGITFSAANLSGDFFINYELSMLVELPSYFVAIFLLTACGRRFTMAGSLLITGLACLATGVGPSDPPVYQITFSLIGKFFASISAAALYTFTSELFPTNCRSATIGLCSTSARIGTILAPIVANLGRRYGTEIPFTIFAVVNMVAAFICLTLPETNNIELPATIQDAKDLSKTNLPCFRCGEKKS